MKKTALIVGLYGGAGVGKTTLALALSRHLQDDYKIKTAILNFADQLKLAVAMKFGMPISDLYSQEGKRKVCAITGKTYRDILQQEGTELARHAYRDDFWIQRIQLGQLWRWDPMREEIYSITDEVQSADIVILGDVRFDDEAEFTIDHGGEVVHVKGSRKAELAAEEATHSSEAGISPELITLSWDNSGSLGDLENWAASYANNLAKALAEHPAGDWDE